MSYVRCLRGIASGREYPADVPVNLDPADGRPLQMVLDLERLAAEKPAAAWYDPHRRDMWRFGALMALFALNRLTQVFRPADETATAQPAPQEGDL